MFNMKQESYAQDVPAFQADQLLQDIHEIGKNLALEREMARLASVQIEELVSPPVSELPTHPSKPEQISDAVKRAVEFIGIESQLKQQAVDVEKRQVGDRLERNLRKIDQLLGLLKRSSILPTSDTNANNPAQNPSTE
ncbi:hypothetical protein O181_072552 [Austropuccinia psidii MF-1]|uniref:Uncharacterized protein n=1 Tax=Austropuccinia psidii MF-1 TaxID=1389203 RepID=A0A9Q3F7C9_9BASI|nr:hypothetical protein [Austropuccinia psidii MF-1]